MVNAHREGGREYRRQSSLGKTIFACNLHEGNMMQASNEIVEGYGLCRPIDMVDSSVMKKVYCSCGCILDLDRSYFNRRMDLGKELECVHCRNLRISREIDEMNAHFNGESLNEDGFLF